MSSDSIFKNKWTNLVVDLSGIFKEIKHFEVNSIEIGH